MEAKKWGFAMALIFIFTVVLLTLLVLHQDPNKSWQYMDAIVGIFGGINPIEPSAGNYRWMHEDNKRSVSINLSSCHSSYGRPDLLVNCCPPAAEDDQDMIDFEFPDPSSPLRIRRPAHHADDDYIAKYKRALSIMMSLPHSDPRSFSRQADLHCLLCTGAYDLPHSHHVPFDVHGTWYFYPLHRMYLYFHERILGSLIGDDTFALPFWNWDSPLQMAIPPMYLSSPFSHDQRDSFHLPPKIVDFSFTPYHVHENDQYGDDGDQNLIHSNLALLYKQVVSGAKKPELFMGCPFKAGDGGACHATGTVENAPHNTIHSWVGSNLNPGRESMGTFYSAARDPLFYPHHSNLDRLWDVWRSVHKIDMDKLDPAWQNSFFYFHDENSRLVKIKVLHVLNATNLRYAYENVENPWLNIRPRPPIRGNKTSIMLPSRREGILAVEFGEIGRNLDRSITAKVRRSKCNRRKQEKEEEEVLIVHGIDVTSDEYVKFDVYINVGDDESMSSPSLREFAGTFVHMPHGKMGGNQKTSLKMGISELLQDLEAERDEIILVTLIPKTQSCKNTIIDRIHIECMK